MLLTLPFNCHNFLQLFITPIASWPRLSFTKHHRALNLAKKKKVILKFFIEYSSPVAIFKSTSYIKPNITPLRKTTKAVANGVIIRSFPSPLCFRIPFAPFPGQCFQHLPLSVMLSRRRNLTTHITEQSCNGFDILNILQEILTM